MLLQFACDLNRVIGAVGEADDHQRLGLRTVEIASAESIGQVFPLRGAKDVRVKARASQLLGKLIDPSRPEIAPAA